jgi:hypothetical protein
LHPGPNNPQGPSSASSPQWEALLLAERARGEAGWSAEWRKAALSDADRRHRTRRWREYACEAFCDSAAALWASPGLGPRLRLVALARLYRALSLTLSAGVPAPAALALVAGVRLGAEAEPVEHRLVAPVPVVAPVPA